MNLKQKNILLLFFFLLPIVLLLGLSAEVNAEGEEPESPTISINNYSVYPGNYASLSVQANNLVNLASLELEIYYDASSFNLNNIYATGLSDAAQVSINGDLAGKIVYTMISLEGLNGNGSLIQISLQAKEDANYADFPITLVIGEAYDITLQPVSIVGSSGMISVIENDNIYVNQIYFYDNINKSSAYFEDEITLNIFTYNAYGLASANFEFRFDSSVFDYLGVTLSPGLNHPNALFSTNDSISGYIKISYASLTAVNCSDFLTLRLKVKVDMETESDITFNANNIYDENLNPLSSNSVLKSIFTLPSEIVPDFPVISLTDFSGSSADSFSVSIFAEGNSNLAAGDFTVAYDQNLLDCLSVQANSALSESGSLIIINPTFNAGVISFSFVCENGISTNSNLVDILFKAKNNVPLSSEISIIGRNVVDSNFNNISIEYVKGTISLGTFFRVDFVDWDNTFIKAESVKQGDSAISPENPTRANCVFVGWDKTFTNIQVETVVKAIYRIDPSFLTFSGYSGTYDRQPHSILVSGLFEGSSAEYTNATQIEAGSTIANALIYLDGVYQLTLSAEIAISPKTANVTIEDKTSGYGDDLETLTCVASGVIESDDLQIALTKSSGENAGIYDITGSSSNGNYEVTFVIGKYTITKIPVVINATDVQIEYDGNVHSVIANSESDGLITYVNNGHSGIGTYEVGILIGEGTNHLSGTKTVILTIYDASVTIFFSDFLLTVSARAVQISCEKYSNLFLSIDGTNFENGMSLTNLTPKTDYSLTLYVGKTQGFHASNNLTIEFTTFQDIEVVRGLVSGEVDLSSFSKINQAETEFVFLCDSDKLILRTELDAYIASYNSFVDLINSEYETGESLTDGLLSLSLLATLGTLDLAVFLLKRRIYA